MDSNLQTDSIKSLVEALEGFVAGRIGLTEASRTVCAVRFALHQEQNALFLPFVGIDSETDKFPVGVVREFWASDALSRYDSDRESTEQHYLRLAHEAAAPLLAWARAYAP